MNAEHALRRVADVAPPILSAAFRNDCCIAATGIAYDVFRHFGIASRALPVRFLVANARFIELVDRGEEPLADPTSWAIGVTGSGRRQRRATGEHAWDGHLVLVVERRWLLDLTLGQARRPAKGILLPDVFVGTVPPGWPTSDDEQLTYRLRGGCAICYVPQRGNRGYTGSPDWRQRRTKLRHVTAAIIRAV